MKVQPMEHECPVTGPAYYRWGLPHGYPYAALQTGAAGQQLIEGCINVRGCALQSASPLPNLAGLDALSRDIDASLVKAFAAYK